MNDKVLICAPIGGKKQYSINEWFKWIALQEYKNFDVALCANGEGSSDLVELIKQVRITLKDKESRIEKRVIALELRNSTDLTIIQKITYAREKLRRYAVKENYDYIFFLDTDTIPMNWKTIQLLMDYKKDCISGVYPYKNSSKSTIIDEKTKTNMFCDDPQIVKSFETHEPFEVWGFGFGCLLLSKTGFQKGFDYDLFGEERTDDYGYCRVLSDQKIPRWITGEILCQHLGSKDNKASISSHLSLEIEGGRDA